jgi:hypothetical protein
MVFTTAEDPVIRRGYLWNQGEHEEVYGIPGHTIDSRKRMHMRTAGCILGFKMNWGLLLAA